MEIVAGHCTVVLDGTAAERATDPARFSTSPATVALRSRWRAASANTSVRSCNAERAAHARPVPGRAVFATSVRSLIDPNFSRRVAEKQHDRGERCRASSHDPVRSLHPTDKVLPITPDHTRGDRPLRFSILGWSKPGSRLGESSIDQNQHNRLLCFCDHVLKSRRGC